MRSASCAVDVGHLLAFALAAQVAVWPAAARADSAAEAEEMIKRAVALRKQGDHQSALGVLQTAHALAPSPRSAGQLAMCEQALGHWVDSAIHYAEAIEGKSHPWVQKNRAVIDEAIQTVHAHVGRVRVGGAPAGAEVAINGRMSGRLPHRAPVPVEPGSVRVEVRSAGYVTGGFTISVNAGQETSVEVRLQEERAAQVGGSTPGSSPAGSGASGALTAPLAAPTIASARSPAMPVAPVIVGASQTQMAAPDTSKSWMPPTRLATLVATGAFLTAGIVGTVMHEGKVSDFNDPARMCKDSDGTAINSKTLMPDAACQSLLDGASRQRKIAAVGFVGAGVLALTSAILYITF